MEPVAIPKTIDDLIHLLLWSADEIVPFMVCMLSGMLIDQFIPALALGAIAVKFSGAFVTTARAVIPCITTKP